MNIKQVNYIEFEDFARALETVLGMTYCSDGKWNAPKDRASFEIVLTHPGDDCDAFEGDHKWSWMGHVNKPYKYDGVVKNATQGHYEIGFYDCLNELYLAGILTEDFYVISLSW